jgi:DNA-directed RNA polymerase specialized sigma24 family protein
MQVAAPLLALLVALAFDEPFIGITLVLAFLLAARAASWAGVRALQDGQSVDWYRADRVREADDASAALIVLSYQAGYRPSALDELNRRYWDRVLGCAWITVADADDPEYVTRRVFMQVSEALGELELDPSLPFRVWLFRIARSTLLDARAGRLRGSRPARPRLRGLGSTPGSSFIPTGDPNEYIGLMLGRALDLSLQQLAAEVDRPPAEVRKLLRDAERFSQTKIGSPPGGRGNGDRLAMRMRPRRGPVLAARRRALVAQSPPPGLHLRG